jgi:hypothetical protein
MFSALKLKRRENSAFRFKKWGGNQAKKSDQETEKVNPLPQILTDQNSRLQCG